jgi:hypothetical protein
MTHGIRTVVVRDLNEYMPNSHNSKPNIHFLDLQETVMLFVRVGLNRCFSRVRLYAVKLIIHSPVTCIIQISLANSCIAGPAYIVLETSCQLQLNAWKQAFSSAFPRVSMTRTQAN